MRHRHGGQVFRRQFVQGSVAAAGLVQRVDKPVLDPTAVQDAIEALLDAAPCPTAIVTGSDVLAGSVYVAASRRKIQIGTELAVTGFDGGMASRLLNPSLTTLAILEGTKK